MDDNDSLFLGVLDLVKLTNFTVINDVTLICTIRINPAQNVHQRGLACAVLTDQRVDFSLFHFQIYVVERLDTRECFGNIFHFQ